MIFRLDLFRDTSEAMLKKLKTLAYGLQCFSPLVPVTRNLKKLMEHEEMHKMSHRCCAENGALEEDVHEASLEVEQARMAKVVIEDTKVSHDAKERDAVGTGTTTPTPTRRSNAPVVLMPEPVKHEPPPGKGIRKSCHTCAFSWTDFHRKNECPKCFSPLVPKTRNLKTLTQFSGQMPRLPQGSAVAIKAHGRHNSADGNEYAGDSSSVSLDAVHSENVIGESTAGSTPRWMPQDQSWSFSSLDMELDPSSALGADAVRREFFKVSSSNVRPQVRIR